MKLDALAALVLAVTAAACGNLETRGEGAPTERAPAFALSDDTGATVALSDLIADGPAVLVFYRGHW